MCVWGAMRMCVHACVWGGAVGVYVCACTCEEGMCVYAWGAMCACVWGGPCVCMCVCMCEAGMDAYAMYGGPCACVCGGGPITTITSCCTPPLGNSISSAT